MTSQSTNSNCAADKNAEGVCHFSAYASTDSSRAIDAFVLSCKPFDPDVTHATTLEKMKEKAANELGLSVDDVIIDKHTCSGRGTTTALSTDELLRYKMASNCATHNFDLSDVNSMNKFSCQYYGPRKDEFGQVGYNLTDRLSGRLASCDAGGFDPQTERDIRKIVAHQLESSAPDVAQHLDKIRCDVFTVPMGL